MSEEKKLQATAIVAIVIAALALGVSYRVSVVPWRTLADAQGKVVAFRELQLQQLQTAAQQAVTTALSKEKARFSDLLRLLETYDRETMKYIEANGDTPDGPLAEAIEQAQSRVTEWRGQGR